MDINTMIALMAASLMPYFVSVSSDEKAIKLSVRIAKEIWEEVLEQDK